MADEQNEIAGLENGVAPVEPVTDLGTHAQERQAYTDTFNRGPISTRDVASHLHALNQAGTVAEKEDGSIELAVDTGKGIQIVPLERKAYSQHDILVEVLKAKAKANPEKGLPADGPIAEDPEKDKARMKSAQPGAHIEPGRPATPTPIAKGPQDAEKLDHDEAFKDASPANQDEIAARESQQHNS